MRQRRRDVDSADTAALRAEIEALKAIVADEGGARTSRRRMLRLAGAGTLGAAASAVAGGGRASAADQDVVQVGFTHYGTRTTELLFGTTAPSASTPGSGSAVLMRIDNATTNPSDQSIGLDVRGASVGITANGATGVSSSGTFVALSGTGGSLGLVATGTAAGVRADSTAGNGVEGSGGDVGVAGIGGSVGVRGVGIGSAAGVFGTSTEGIGVDSLSMNGVGLNGSGGLIGARATGTALTGDGVHASGRYAFVATGSRLAAAWLPGVDPGGGEKTSPLARTDVHRAGELEVDAAGNLWWCAVEGAPGTWRKIAGPASAGTFHAVTPTRVYDSRVPTPTPGLLQTGQTRHISVASRRNLVTGAIIEADLVPAGATAIACNVTVANTQLGGFLTLNPGGTTAVSAATINWSDSNQILNNGVIVAINPASREITAVAGGPPGAMTDFIIDVTGYFA